MRPEGRALWTSDKCPWPTKLTALKCRFGCLWTAKRARLLRMPYNGGPVRLNDDGAAACPLCNQTDGATHILGGCAHPSLHGLYIKRHDEAVKMVFRQLAASKEPMAILMDAGKRDDLPDQVLNTKETLSTWLTAVAPTAVPRDAPYLTAPDLVIFHGLSLADIQGLMATNTRLPHGQRVTLIEVGYCSDTQAQEKLMEKRNQHASLLRTLQQAGLQATLHAIPLGTTGITYTHMDALTTAFKLPAGSTSQLHRQLTIHAAQYAHMIVCARRQTEAPMRATLPHTPTQAPGG